MHKYSLFSHNWLALKTNNEQLKKNLPLIKGIVYDLGCGIRPYEKDILSNATQYVGVDWSNSYHNLNADIIADLNAPLPIAAESADTITSFSVMEHLSNPQTMLNEAFRILKPDGNIVLQVPWQWWIHEAPYDFYRFTPYGIIYMFKIAGFQEVVVEPQTGFFSMLILKMNYFSARYIGGPKPLRLFIKSLLLPFWFLGQCLAPTLDKIDRNWPAEACGYYVTAKKTCL